MFNFNDANGPNDASTDLQLVPLPPTSAGSFSFNVPESGSGSGAFDLGGGSGHSSSGMLGGFQLVPMPLPILGGNTIPSTEAGVRKRKASKGTAKAKSSSAKHTSTRSEKHEKKIRAKGRGTGKGLQKNAKSKMYKKTFISQTFWAEDIGQEEKDSRNR